MQPSDRTNNTGCQEYTSYSFMPWLNIRARAINQHITITSIKFRITIDEHNINCVYFYTSGQFQQHGR